MSIGNDFYKGKYEEVLSQIGSDPLDVSKTDFATLTAFQIGALVFLGQVSEAKLIFKLAEPSTTHNYLFTSRCLFFLGIGCARISQYAEASTYFAKSLNNYRKNRAQFSAEEKFFVYQGVAFYRFFQGHFARTLKLAQFAYESSFASQFRYGQVLSLDLVGHSLCQIGKIRRGIFELNRAHAISSKIGNGGIETALRISIEKYKAMYGINLDTAIEDLENALSSLEPQDTYSQAELYLELVRHLILRGQGSKAQKTLELAGNIIYKHQNKIQMTVFNHRYSHLLLLRGDRLAARALLASLKSNLNPQVDRVTLAQIAGLERKINMQFSENVRSTYFNFIDQRIQQREEQKSKAAAIEKGEDPLGDLLDLIAANDPLAYALLKNKKLFGVLPKVFNIPLGASAIYLGPKRSEIIIFDGADVRVIDQGITQPMKKLLGLFAHGQFHPKEFLIEKTWNYKYDQRIHDNVLYALIGKLRKLLGPYANWIEWSNAGYGLAPHVILMNPDSSVQEKAVKPMPDNFDLTANLNFRQIKTLKTIRSIDFINVRIYAKLHKICTMTAYRDLAYLQRRGFLIRVGKGRSTVYVSDESKS